MPDELSILRAIVETQEAIGGHLDDPQAVMDIVTARSQLMTQAEGAVVELIEGDEMVYRAVSGSAEGSLGLRLQAATSLSGLCVSERRPLRCDDSETDDRVDREACRRVGVRSMVVVPLEPAAGRCVGVLKVLSPEPAAFGDDTMSTLATMARFIATALEHSTAYRELGHRARHDALTGLANRAATLERVAVGLARARRGAGPVTVLYLDLDGFKEINDSLGHDAGDRRLIEVAELLTTSVRANDLVGRLGGDEFVIVCEDLATQDEQDLLERLRVLVHGSVGVATSTEDDTAETLLARADQRMYADKRARGRPVRR